MGSHAIGSIRKADPVVTSETIAQPKAKATTTILPILWIILIPTHL